MIWFNPVNQSYLMMKPRLSSCGFLIFHISQTNLIKKMNTYYKFAPNVFLAKCDEKHEKVKLLKLPPSMEKKMNVLFSTSFTNVMDSITTQSYGLMALMCKSGPNKELNVVMNGLHLLYRKAVNITTSPIKIRIFFL